MIRIIKTFKKIYFKRLIKLFFIINPIYAFNLFCNSKKSARNNIRELKPLSEDLRIGIIIEPSGFHNYYINACHELNIPFVLIDIFKPDWLDQIRTSGCAGFLCWQSASLTIWRDLYDERIKVIEEELKIVVHPSLKEIWMWESKRRMHYWLEANKIKHPRAWIFYDYEEAKSFIVKASYPIVFKTNHGDSSRGVRIVRTRKQAMHLINKSFGRGTNYSTNYPMDKEWGSIFFQEYIPEATEWRIIRVGNSYFGYQKVKIGDFASGHGEAHYCEVPTELLDYVREITEKHNFRSMSFDILQSRSNGFFIIELQSLFGDTKSGRKCMVDGKPGRYIFNKKDKRWIFEEGIFDQNNCANLRVEWILDLIKENIN